MNEGFFSEGRKGALASALITILLIRFPIDNCLETYGKMYIQLLYCGYIFSTLFLIFTPANVYFIRTAFILQIIISSTTSSTL